MASSSMAFASTSSDTTTSWIVLHRRMTGKVLGQSHRDHQKSVPRSSQNKCQHNARTKELCQPYQSCIDHGCIHDRAGTLAVVVYITALTVITANSPCEHHRQ